VAAPTRQGVTGMTALPAWPLRRIAVLLWAWPPDRLPRASAPGCDLDGLRS
jgi:hypothetical protein